MIKPYISTLFIPEIIQTRIHSPSKLTPPAIKLSPSAKLLTPHEDLTILSPQDIPRQDLDIIPPQIVKDNVETVKCISFLRGEGRTQC